jgi:hypothetical protein
MADDTEMELKQLQDESPAFMMASNINKKPSARLELMRDRIQKADELWTGKLNTYMDDFEPQMRYKLPRPPNLRLATDMPSEMRALHGDILLEMLYHDFGDKHTATNIKNVFNALAWKIKDKKTLNKDAYTQIEKYLNEHEAKSPGTKERHERELEKSGFSSKTMKKLPKINAKHTKNAEWKAVKETLIRENPQLGLIDKNFPTTPPTRFSPGTMKAKLATATRKSIARTKQANKPKIKEAWAAQLESDFKEYEKLADFKKILKFASVRGTYDELKARMKAKFDKVTLRSNKKSTANKISTALHKFFDLDEKSKCFTVKLSCAEKISGRAVESFEAVIKDAIKGQ